MARQLPELDELLGNYLADDDLILVRDMSAKQDKRLQFGDLLSWITSNIELPDDYVQTNMIDDEAVTGAKIAALAVLASHIKLSATNTDANGWRSIKIASNVTVYWQNYSFTPTMSGNDCKSGDGKNPPVGISGTIFGVASGNCGDRAIAVIPWITASGGVDVCLQNKFGGNVTSACRINAIVVSIT